MNLERSCANTMSNPWRETKGYSFHSICLHVRDIKESCMFYEEVFGMSVVRESDVGYVCVQMRVSNFKGVYTKHGFNSLPTRVVMDLHWLHRS